LLENEPVGTFVVDLSGQSTAALTYKIVDGEGKMILFYFLFPSYLFRCQPKKCVKHDLMTLFIFFSILGSTDGFAVNPNSGIITTTRSFDHETQYLYNMTVIASDIVGQQVFPYLVCVCYFQCSLFPAQ
jgi:hypothetical protein